MKKSKNQALIAPSLLSADFSRLKDEVQDVTHAGADWIHVDVMDGHFVPNLTIGPLVVQALKPVCKLPLDCHLMVSRPEDWVEEFVRAGASIVTVHAEATHHLHRLVHRVKDLGVKAGVSINPASPLSLLDEVLDEVDLVLVMSVNPGFGGQKFISSQLKKIEKLAKIRGNREFLIEIDGGISASNIKSCRDAGVDVFVAGSSVFGQSNRKKAIQDLRQAMMAAQRGRK